VTDKNAIPIVGLHKDNFMVFDENTQREITYFNADRIPSSIGIIIDLSGSMSNPYRSSLNVIEFVKEGLVCFTHLLDSSDEYFIMTFKKQAELLSDWGQNNTKLDTITAKKLHGGTALFDACYLGIQKVLQSRNQKRLLILITDGGDNESSTKFSQLKQMIRANNLLVYVIGTFFGKPDSHDYDSFVMHQGRLQELTTLSGGQIFLTAAREGVNLAFKAIAEERFAHYLIGFTVTNPTGKSSRHQLKVKVIPPESFPKELQPLVVRSRQGYIANAQVH
jgi:Ca-activated chloride channel family protein